MTPFKTSRLIRHKHVLLRLPNGNQIIIYLINNKKQQLFCLRDQIK